MRGGDTIPYDWYPGQVPANVHIDATAQIDTTFGLARFESLRQPGLILDKGAGIYSNTSLDVAPEGVVKIGAYTCINTAYLICNTAITIGSHCLISWQVVITDTDLGPGISLEAHRQALRRASERPDRRLPELAPSRPVIIEDVVWIGFGSVIMPGVTLGRGSIIGCKTVVDRDVPPGAVVAGNPFRIFRYIDVPDKIQAP